MKSVNQVFRGHSDSCSGSPDMKSESLPVEGAFKIGIDIVLDVKIFDNDALNE